MTYKGYTLMKLNAYGARWHVAMADGRLVFHGETKRACMAYCRRHPLNQ